MASEDNTQLRVLIIDDSLEIREFVTEYILKPHGFLVDMAVDGPQGLKKTQQGSPPDLILLDHEMPGLTGLELLGLLRHHDNKTPVILMTSHGSEQVAVDVFRLGVQDYIIKPFTIEEMLEAIERALSITRLEREKEALTRRVIQGNRQLEQRLHELNVLYKIGKSITTLTEPDTMLARILEAALFITRCEAANLVLLNPNNGEVIERFSKQRLANSGQAKQYVTRPLTYPGKQNGDSKTDLLEKVHSVPLQVGSKVVGTLSISKQREPLTAHDEQLLQMLADYAAITVHNLQLMRQLQLTKEQEKQHIRGLFERYVAPTVVEQMLAQPAQVKLGGTRQPITVLFADVRGFSRFSVRISPEVLFELLNQYIRIAAEAVLAQEGTLDKFMGDAVMAFFNAPLHQPDHALRAVRAAWSLCRMVKDLHRHLPVEHQLDFGVGIGVGEAVVGNVGTDQMMNFTVIGDVVNKAKRLQEQAQGGQVLINQEAYYMLQNCIEAQPVGALQLKGQSRSEPVYQVMGLREHIVGCS